MSDDPPPPPIRRLPDPPPRRPSLGAWHDMTANELERIYRAAYWQSEGDHETRHALALRSLALHVILRDRVDMGRE